jgi:hypothetical protein
VIKDPIQRTRVLYAWEHEMMTQWPGVRRLTLKQANDLLDRIWSSYYPRVRRRRPALVFNGTTGHPYYTTGLITLPEHRQDNVTMIHEATHALGWGTTLNPHSEGFIRAYIETLTLFMPGLETGPWEKGYLRTCAEMRLLLRWQRCGL